MKTIYLIIILTILGLISVVQADNIKWKTINWKPMYIEKGVYKNQGIYDNITSLLSGNMPSYDHTRENMTTSRVIYEMANGKKVCHPSVLIDKKAKQLRSVMNSILLPPQIIINKKALEKLKNVDSYFLKKLLNNKNLIGGLVLDRYSKEINEIISLQKNKKHLFCLKLMMV